jgi:protein-disulfide isomerase
LKRITQIVVGAVLLTWSVAASAQQSLEGMLKERVLGNPDATVELIEYSSLTCPHCASFHKETLGQVKKEFIDTGKVKLVYRDFPLDGLALRAAMLARCAPEDRYFAYLETLFHNQDSWTRSADPIGALGQIARLGGMGKERFEACMADEKLGDGILQIRLDGQKAHDIQSTPTFVVRANGEQKKVIAGAQPFAEFEKVLRPLVGGS